MLHMLVAISLYGALLALRPQLGFSSVLRRCLQFMPSEGIVFLYLNPKRVSCLGPLGSSGGVILVSLTCLFLTFFF